MAAEDVRRSKRLSYVLRHQPDSVGLVLDDAGWTPVEPLLAALGLSRDQLSGVVEGNDKQRFEWDVAADRIRARQGHSVPVELDLPAVPPPPVLYHGTPRRNLASILADGAGPAQAPPRPSLRRRGDRAPGRRPPRRPRRVSG